jgi:hypothetical protein
MTQEGCARENLLRLVAARENSALADFAKDVLAGKREFRELAYSSVGAEEVMRDFQPVLDAWARASEVEREEAIAKAPEELARFNAALTDLDLETQAPQPEPPEDDDWSDWSLRDHSEPT